MATWRWIVVAVLCAVPAMPVSPAAADSGTPSARGAAPGWPQRRTTRTRPPDLVDHALDSGKQPDLPPTGPHLSAGMGVELNCTVLNAMVTRSSGRSVGDWGCSAQYHSQRRLRDGHMSKCMVLKIPPQYVPRLFVGHPPRTPSGAPWRPILVYAHQASMAVDPDGPDLDTLYVTSIGNGGTVPMAPDQPLAGGLFACQPGMKGLPEPMFAG